MLFFACKEPKRIHQEIIKNNARRKLHSAMRLIGKWQDSLEDDFSAETREKKNDSCFLGNSFFLKGKDTVSGEFIQLVQTGVSLFYGPIVRRRHPGEPVRLVNTLQHANQLVFENPLHVFPQMIIDTFLKQDSMLTEISGTINRKAHSVKIPMARVK